jgi:hypothetical protein
MGIITKPKEIEKNIPVSYTANSYIAIPDIDIDNGGIKSLNITSLKNKGLIEIRGNPYLFTAYFYQGDDELKPSKIETKQLSYFIPEVKYFMKSFEIVSKVYCDTNEKGLVLEFLSPEDVSVKLKVSPSIVNLLRFNSHRTFGYKYLQRDKWLNNPSIVFKSLDFELAMAFGGDREFHCPFNESIVGIDHDLYIEMFIEVKKNMGNAFYISMNSEGDGASTTLIHLKRKGYTEIYNETVHSLENKIIDINNNKIKDVLNQNLIFNYFFSSSKDFFTDQLVTMTSRSPRYYVSGAFWERDFFLWSLKGIKICDREYHKKLYREMVIRHSINPGDHAHYIDGTVLYPGFELDEAASYFVDLDFEEGFFDKDIVNSFDRIVERIEREKDEYMGLYKTFLFPSDDPALDQQFVLIDNAILLKGYRNLRNLYKKLGKETITLEQGIKDLEENLPKFIKRVDGKEIYVWSLNKKGDYMLYNDPPGNLGTLVYYGFTLKDDPIFINTINYYYSVKYKYFDKDSNFKELACDHHPNTPSGLGLCGSLLNPLMAKDALDIALNANMDGGLLAESFDKNTGDAKTGTGFATGSGYLAYALHHAIKMGYID